MTPEDIDDMFRAQLDGHATPPGEDLWARLRAKVPAEPAQTPVPGAVPAERLDQLFQQRLAGHATPPGRALWERLEDEHLRPRPRRTAAWWPMALAAAVALLLVAGGAGLWLGFPLGAGSGTTVATQPPQATRGAAGNPASRPTPARAAHSTATNAAAVAAAAPNAAQTTPASTSQALSKNTQVQATHSTALASTAPKASLAAPGPSPRHLKGTSRQPDAAAKQRPLLARATTRPATAPALIRPSAADEPLKTAATAPVLAVVPTPPAPEIVPAALVPALAPGRSNELITVDVRRGGDPATGAAEPVTATASAAPAERRRLGGRLLLQAGHLARGERVSLAEVTGLPENLTLRATVAGRRLTKSIQL